MNYLKYFKNDKFEMGKNDCWSLMIQIYKDEHNLDLPACPICSDDKEYSRYIQSNINLKTVKKAHKGVLVHVSSKFEHVGYAINDKEYIHKMVNGVMVEQIPHKALLYEVSI